MSRDLTPKDRNAVYQHWCSQITRECRDRASLETMSARALQDSDVRGDAQLQSMIRAEFERCRAELQREEQADQQCRGPAPRPTTQYRSPARRESADLLWSPSNVLHPAAAPPAPRPAPPPPDPDQLASSQWAENFSEALKAGDEDAARAACAQMRAIHERRSEIVSTALLEQYEQRLTQLHAQLDNHRRQIATLAAQAQAAAQAGDAPAALQLLHRLTAIHVTHPRLLDEAGLQRMRAAVEHSSESYDDGETTRKLLERERAVAAEMKRLANAVSEFHRAVFSHPESRAEFRRAARVYLHVLHEIRLHEKDWLTDFVLELGDVLANWNVPPPGAAKQIDHFLEKVRGALKRIHVQMSAIDAKQGESKAP
jgi:hypothetical protein